MLTIAEVSGHSFVEDFLPANPTVVDFGSSRGNFARVLVQKFGATVLAAEASPALYSALATLALPNYTVFHAAIAGHTGTVALNLHRDRDASITGPGAGDLVHVPALTLQGFLDKTGLTRVDLLKVDIEGAELIMLSGASDEALLRSLQISVEFHEFLYPDMHSEIQIMKRRLTGLGFVAVDFTRVNGDVLFLHPSLALSGRQRLWLRTLRWAGGVRRVAARAWGVATE
jgi:FkbM family methyltransferase